jgi:hypothetical protein
MKLDQLHEAGKTFFNAMNPEDWAAELDQLQLCCDILNAAGGKFHIVKAIDSMCLVPVGHVIGQPIMILKKNGKRKDGSILHYAVREGWTDGNSRFFKYYETSSEAFKAFRERLELQHEA